MVQGTCQRVQPRRCRTYTSTSVVLDEQRSGGSAQVPLAVGGVLEELAAHRQVAPGRADVPGGLEVSSRTGSAPVGTTRWITEVGMIT